MTCHTDYSFHGRLPSKTDQHGIVQVRKLRSSGIHRASCHFWQLWPKNRLWICHNITLLRGCMVAGLPLPCIKGGALGYKSAGRSRIYDSKNNNQYNQYNQLPSCLYAPPVNLDRIHQSGYLYRHATSRASANLASYLPKKEMPGISG